MCLSLIPRLLYDFEHQFGTGVCVRFSDLEIFIEVFVLFKKVMLDAPHLVVLVNLLYVALDVGLLAESLVALLAPEL